MTTLTHGRMRRHTRPADFVSKSRKAQAMTFSRPGGRTFSFTGEFPEMLDSQPVEATSRRRNYTAGHTAGSYQAVRAEDTSRMPAVSKHGVRFVPAMVMLFALMFCLGSVMLTALAERESVQSAINYKQSRIATLTSDCANVERAIASQSNDVNIRQEAVRMGLISSKGVKVQYLDAPADAVITLADTSAIPALAAIWGR